MKLTQYLNHKKSLFFLIFLLSLIALAPYCIATFYIQPNADDFTFSKELSELNRLNFIEHYYQTWSGRFFAFTLLSLPKADIINSPYWYTIIPNLFMFLTGFGIYKIHTLFLKHVLTKWKIIILSFFFLAFYITGLREVFSALFWNCSSYYLIANVFFLWFIYEFLNFIINKNKVKSFNYIKLLILAFLVCGLTEIYIISLIVVLGIIVLFKYFVTKKINLPIVTLIIIVCIGGYFNILSPGSLNRMDISKTDGGLPFIYSAYRAFYNLIILQLAPLFYSGLLFLLLLVLLYGNKLIVNNEKLKSFFNLNPLFTFSVVIFTFYLHHAMSLYGAGYVLQGRVLNITNLLLYLSLAFVVMNTVVYYNIDVQLNKWIGLISIFILAFSINFSVNSRIVGKEALVDFPIFNTEMNLRYKQITEAKAKGQTQVTIDRISVDLRSLYLGYQYTANQSYYNSKKICYDLSNFFGIDVKIKDDNYDSLAE